MSTLTDRYVWGVLRAIPTGSRAELEPEIRAMVADAVEAQQAAGTAPGAAERAALVELGDPDALAARYTDRSLYLIGPAHFGEWKRLLSLLLPIVVLSAGFGVMVAGYLGGKAVGELILDGVFTALMAGVQVAFWITAVFAWLERSGQPPLGDAWTPDHLPQQPVERSGASPAELAFSVVALVVLAGALIWQQAAQPITIDGQAYALFDPALWSFWLPWFLAVLGLEIVSAFVRWRVGGWTWPLATVNLVLDVAFAVPALYLLQNGLLLDPGLLAAIDAQAGSEWLQPAIAVTTAAVVVITGWDAIDGFRHAWMRSRG